MTEHRTATIKPLQDARGRTPDPPLPGYQQFLYGVPAGLYTADELLYRRESPRTDSPYGFSRVEAIILRINQALRKETLDLGRFTDGNVPAGFIVPPQAPDEYKTWTADVIQVFEDEFNALLAGNDRARNRIKVLLPGSNFIPAQPPDLFTDFDRFLLNVTVASFGLTMAELGFTENVNKSSGDSQENVVYRRAVRPVAGLMAALFTRVLRDEWDPKGRYTFAWNGLEEEDKASVADRYAKLIPVGAASIDDYCAELGLPKPGIGRYIQTGKGPVWITPEIVAAAIKAQTATHEATAQHPFGPPKASDESGDDGSDGDDDEGQPEASRYDPSEPREPAGSPEGGHWGRQGGAGFVPRGAPRGEPVGNHLHPSEADPGFAREAARLVDHVHGDGLPPDTPMLAVSKRSLGAHEGAYVPSRPGETGQRIFVAQTATEPHLTTLHEIGHFVDQHVLGRKGKPASEDPENHSLDEWRKAVDATPTVQRLKQAARTGKATVVGATGKPTTTAVNKARAAYLLRPDELVARSYAQYIAQHHPGHPVATELEADHASSGTLRKSLPEHWNLVEYEPVAKAFDDLFERKLWTRGPESDGS